MGLFRSSSQNATIKAAKKADLDKVQKLARKKKLEVAVADAEGATALHWTCLHPEKRESEMICQVLLDGGADVAARDTLGQLPLHYASRTGSVAVLKKLLLAAEKIQGSANFKEGPNCADVYGKTPLHVASANDRDEATALLLQSGADADAVDLEGCTPLHHACLNGQSKSVARLLDAGALTDVFATQGPAKGLTPIQTAQRYGHEKVMSIIATHLADPRRRLSMTSPWASSRHRLGPRTKASPHGSGGGGGGGGGESRLNGSQHLHHHNYTMWGDFDLGDHVALVIVVTAATVAGITAYMLVGWDGVVVIAQAHPLRFFGWASFFVTYITLQLTESMDDEEEHIPRSGFSGPAYDIPKVKGVGAANQGWSETPREQPQTEKTGGAGQAGGTGKGRGLSISPSDDYVTQTLPNGRSTPRNKGNAALYKNDPEDERKIYPHVNSMFGPPDGENCSSEPPSENVLLRGKNYLEDRIKQPSKRAIFEPVGLWVLQPGTDHLALNDPTLSAHLKRYPDTEWFFVVWNIPTEPLSASTLYAFKRVVPPGADPLFDDLWHRFKTGDDEFRNERFKFLPNVMDGPWALKAAFARLGGMRPVILGKKLLINHYIGPNYVELDIDVGSDRIASFLCNFVFPDATSKVVVDLSYTLEGKNEAELPERLLGTFRNSYVELKDLLVDGSASGGGGGGGGGAAAAHEAERGFGTPDASEASAGGGSSVEGGRTGSGKMRKSSGAIRAGKNGGAEASLDSSNGTRRIPPNEVPDSVDLDSPPMGQGEKRRKRSFLSRRSPKN